jgi:hypothetical protein
MNNFIGDKGEKGDNGILKNCYHLLHYNKIVDIGSDLSLCQFDSNTTDNIVNNLVINDNTFSLINYNDISNNVFVELYAHADVSNINITNNQKNTTFSFLSISGEQLIKIDTRSVIKERFNVLHLSYGPVILKNNQINFNDQYNLTIETTNQNNITIREIKLIIKLLKK